MTDWHIISHKLEPDAGVYRLVVGRPVVDVVYPVVADSLINTQYTSAPVEPGPSLNEGDPLPPMEDYVPPEWVAHDEEIPTTKLGEPEEVIVGYDNVLDFVFAADDPQWFDQGQRRDDGVVADEQRALVKEALDAHANEAAAAEAAQDSHVEMPGAGGAL